MLSPVRDSLMTMLLQVQSRTTPSPTPMRMALHGVLSTQLVTTTLAQSWAASPSGAALARRVMQSSPDSIRQSLTVTSWQQSRSIPSPLAVWGGLVMCSRRTCTHRQPWRNSVQYGALRSVTSRTATSVQRQKKIIWPGRQPRKGKLRLLRRYERVISASGNGSKNAAPLPSMVPSPVIATCSWR